MSPRTKWVDRGRAITEFGADVLPADNNLTFRHFKLLRVTSRQGLCDYPTLIEFDLEHCCLSSLQYAAEILRRRALEMPVVLRIYRLGWFSELHGDPDSAASRIEELAALQAVPIARSCHYISVDCEPDMAEDHIEATRAGRVNGKLVLSQMASNGEVPMLHVGASSVLAKLEGPDWIAKGRFRLDPRYRSGDAHMVRTFDQVLGDGRPRLEEVAMLVAETDITEAWWLRIHRLCVPAGNDRVASYCIESGLPITLNSAAFGRPGPGLAVALSV